MLAAADKSGLFQWAHTTARGCLRFSGGRYCAGSEVMTYRQLFTTAIRDAWQSEALRKRFGLYGAEDRARARRAAEWHASCAAAVAARDDAHRANCIAWARQLNDGQLLSATFDAERNDDPLYCDKRFLSDWQAKSDNRIKLAALRAEQASRNSQKEAA
jgi:hypothetical protein